MDKKKTTVGDINSRTLAFTAGRDAELDLQLIEFDCIGTAAHVTMLSELDLEKALFSKEECNQIIQELKRIIDLSREGDFEITLADQDVHLAVERTLTEKLGDLGRKVHTGRSRNDQIAVDLRLFGRAGLLELFKNGASLAKSLLNFGHKNRTVPMVGRTHQQPAMPSSVGLWASAHAESLLDDLKLLKAAYQNNNQSPLGSVAGYGVPLPLDREKTSRLLGFDRPIRNVLYAGNARGKTESIILSAASQIMLTLSRLAQDLILFSMPEFNYFRLPSDFCTGSSIMPQKNNPDVLELIRAKSASVWAYSGQAYELVKGLPSGYNRDLQEAKEPFLRGLKETEISLAVLIPLIDGMSVNEDQLRSAFTSGVYATDRAIELVAKGKPFREAYDQVKDQLQDLEGFDPEQALQNRKHFGAPLELDWDGMLQEAQEWMQFAKRENQNYRQTTNALFKAIG